jgi:hypothetical protein
MQTRVRFITTRRGRLISKAINHITVWIALGMAG